VESRCQSTEVRGQWSEARGRGVLQWYLLYGNGVRMNSLVYVGNGMYLPTYMASNGGRIAEVRCLSGSSGVGFHTKHRINVACFPRIV
jgi:hypothetical protein